MGRKIPGKKHHGVKDPEVQRERREEKIKFKINAAPKDAEAQEIPKRLRMLMRAKEMLQQEEEAKMRARKEGLTTPAKTKPKVDAEEEDLLDSSKQMGYEMRLPGMKRPLKPIPVFKQNPGETQRRFFNRMERTVQDVLKRKKYEDKYDVEVTDDPETGKTTVKSREKDEIDEEMDKIAKKKKKKKGVTVRSKEEKRQLKRQKEKEKRQKKKRRQTQIQEDDEMGFTNFHDEVKFNEVAMAPPTLKLKKATGQERMPGKSSSLLLKGKIESKKGSKSATSMAKQKMLDAERLRVIGEYRKLKANAAKPVK